MLRALDEDARDEAFEVRVDERRRRRRAHRAEEDLRAQIDRKERAHFFHRKEKAADWCSERGGNSRRGASRDEISLRARVPKATTAPCREVESIRAPLRDAGTDERTEVNHRTLRPYREPGGNGKDNGDKLDETGRHIEDLADQYAVEEGHNLGHSARCCGGLDTDHKARRDGRKERADADAPEQSEW